MNIGIIGSGNVGGALGARWAQAGHQVLFASRTPQSEDMQRLVAQAGPNSRAALAGEVVAASDILLLATPWEATRNIVQNLGSLHGKTLIDATNPLLPGLAGIEFGTTTSGGEQVAAWAPGARVVKAFNTVGNNIMADATFAAARPTLFYCGDQAEAKQQIHQLAEQLGFEPMDAGPLAQARLLEPLALLWISLALVQGLGRDIAFQLMRR